MTTKNKKKKKKQQFDVWNVWHMVRHLDNDCWIIIIGQMDKQRHKQYSTMLLNVLERVELSNWRIFKWNKQKTMFLAQQVAEVNDYDFEKAENKRRWEGMFVNPLRKVCTHLCFVFVFNKI